MRDAPSAGLAERLAACGLALFAALRVLACALAFPFFAIVVSDWKSPAIGL